VKLPAYPRTKPSGVEWLGDVPEHWEVKRLGHAARLQGGYAFKSEIFGNDGVPVIQMNNLKNGRLDLSQANRIDPGECLREFALKAGDIVMGMTGSLGNRATVTIEDLPAQLNQRVGRFVVTQAAEPMFVWFVIQSAVFSEQVLLSATGTAQLNISSSQIESVRLPLPPVPEQRAIAAFLDRETGRVDRLVAKKRELIERLKEKRTALISRTVTRGLPPAAARATGLPENPPLKPSGLDWLGEIPRHWDVVRLGRRIELQRGVDITKDEQSEGTVPVVSSGGISSFHDTAFVRGPGVVVGRKGTAGAVYYVECDYWPHDTTLYVREFRGNDPRYVFYKLCSMDLATFDTGSANPTLNRNLVHPVFVSWPPLPEQAAIAGYLDKETAKLDALVGKVEEAAERLQEYRTALITAAVTGKIDVRHKSKLNTITA
jgi:type I restriction enzyme, S subunit